ncbi:MAG: hypothetical protein ABMA15_29845 [Vicinamibacterales bacterium]
MPLSRTQIDKLGERLSTGRLEDADLAALDEYRRTFGPAFTYVVTMIRERLGFEPSGRSAKTTSAISDKLGRESIRMSQIQDIAGCRVVVPDVPAQDRAVRMLAELFTDLSIVDRRTAPSYGYRAVHIVVRIVGKPVEVQVRT